MRFLLASFALLIVFTGCGAPASQGPLQPPVPIPKRKAVDRSEFPPPPPPRQKPAAEAPKEAAEAAPPAPPAATQPAVTPAPAPEISSSEPSRGRIQLSPEAPGQQELLTSVLWVQTAQEYQISALQAYRNARRSLDQALEDLAWDALGGDGASEEGVRPTAVILDVDETVLDNSLYEGALVSRGPSTSEGFRSWCLQEASGAVPGALEFTRYAASKNVAVFYVTNRNHEVEEATRRNLEKLGFPLGIAGEDRILTRYERKEWTSDKTSRRQEVARDYRVLLLIGDDMNDFAAEGRGSRERRATLLEETSSKWGREWILLPNPMYGSWSRALTWGAGEQMTHEQKLELKSKALRAAP